MILRRPNADLPERLDALRQASEIGSGRLTDANLDHADLVAVKAQDRLRHGTTHTLVALLGATGSGKSSVTNAIVGSDVATAGLRRPTTSSTLGCYWGANDAQPLLDWLEVPNRHHVAGSDVAGSSVDNDAVANLEGLVLLDVPDHDSVEVSHRLEMERIASHVDLLLWITDAEKYADKAMHEYLRQLSEYGAVTAMVLNKADLLTPEATKACLTDMERLLAEDGLVGSPVMSLSATTGEGVDELRSLLADTVETQAAMVHRLEADVRNAAVQLQDDLGSDDGVATIDKKAPDRLAAELVGASGVQAVTDAVSAGHRRDAAAKVGWPFTRWARQLRPHPLRKLHLGQGSGGRSSLPEVSGIQMARSENAVRQIIADTTAGMPDPWPELIAEAATPNQAALNNQLDDAISTSVRAIHADRKPFWWLIANVVQIGLAIAAVVGAVWLALLAFGAYLRLPEVPTPKPYLDIPLPTAMLIGGLILGLLLSAIFRQLAAVGAKRRAARVRRDAEVAVREVSDSLVIDPIQRELDSRNELRGLLDTAAGN